MNDVIKKDLNPDFTYAKTHIAPFQSIGIGLAIFLPESTNYDCNIFNDIRKKIIPYKPGE